MELKNQFAITRYRVLCIICISSIAGLVLLTPLVSAQEDSSIPSWVKTIAKFWASGEIKDQEFMSALQFLVNEKILVIPIEDTDNQQSNTETLISNPQPVMPNPNSITLIVSNILEECERDDICVAFRLTSLSANESENVVMSVLDGIISAWDDEKVTCHQNAHHLGHFLFEYFDRDVEKALANTNNKCGNALYHGVLEDSLLGEIRSENTSLEDLDVTSTCINVGDSPDSNVRLQCLHGMGHAIVMAYDYDLFNAIKRCDDFQTFAEQDMCLDGAFMQNHVENFNNGGGVFDKDDIYYPCNVVDEKYQNRCYIYQAYYILKGNNYSYLPTFEDCERIPTSSEKIIGGCFGGVSNYLSVRTYQTDVDGIAKMCSEANLKYQSYCINVAVFALTRYVDTELAEDFCNVLPDDKTESCINEWQRIKMISNL